MKRFFILIGLLAIFLFGTTNVHASSWDPGLLVNTEAFQIVDEGDGASNVYIQFGDSLAETITFDRTSTRFDFSDDVFVSGDLSASGTLSINTDQTGNAQLTFGNNLADQTISLAEGADDLVVSTGATFSGNLSGASLTASNLLNCDTIDTDANGNFICGSDNTGSGNYVDEIGDTMEGALVVDITIGTGTGLQPDDPSVSGGLELWLDADQLTGLIDGDSVTTWDDESGNGHVITQGTAGYRPTYETNEFGSRPVIRFDGVDDHLQDLTTSYNARTVFIVHRISSTAQSTGDLAQLWGHYADGAHIAPDPRTSEDYFSFDGNGSAQARCGTNGANYGSNFTNGLACDWTYDTAEILTTEFQSAQSMGSTTIASLVPTFAVGAHQYGGDIAEIIVFSTTLTDTQRQDIELYLSLKYGISVVNQDANPQNGTGTIALDITTEATEAAALRIDTQGDSDSPHILFGSGGTFDTNLYRAAANTLQTDDALTVGSNLIASTLSGSSITVSNLKNCDTVITDATGAISCGEDAGDSLFYAYDDSGGLNVDNTQQAIDLDSQVFADADYSHSETVNPSQVTIQTTGTYRIMAQACVEVINNSGGPRGEPRLHIQRDTGGGFTNIDGAMSMTYVREPNQVVGSNLNVEVFQQLDANDLIRMTITDNIANEPNEQTIADCSRLLIQRIR